MTVDAWTASMLRRASGWGRGPVVKDAPASIASGYTSLFTVTGLVAVMYVGRVTTVIQNSACNLKLVSTPSVGTEVDLCAVLNVQADEAGTLYSLSGLNTDAMLGINAGAVPGPLRASLCYTGTIRQNASAGVTGQIEWSAYYVPLSDNASLVAA